MARPIFQPLLLVLALLTRAADALRLGGAQVAPRSAQLRTAPRAAAIRCETEMQYRKRMSGGSGTATPESAPTKEDSSQRRDFNLATDVDAVEMFGSVGGATLTRKGIAEAGRITSDAVVAMERLQDAVKRAGERPAAESAEVLQDLIGQVGAREPPAIPARGTRTRPAAPRRHA